MTTKRIAPLLTTMVREYAKNRIDLHGQTWAAAERELRALLAVARAARIDMEHACGSVEDVATMPETFNATYVRLARAILRLSRSSHPRRSPRGRR